MKNNRKHNNNTRVHFGRKYSINRKYKDQLFRFLFSEKKELLSLYNALHDTVYTNVEDLTITTINDVLYLGMKNDLSFLIGNSINLYEHQNTYNPNMPLRGFFYSHEGDEPSGHACMYIWRLLVALPQKKYLRRSTKMRLIMLQY